MAKPRRLKRDNRKGAAGPAVKDRLTFDARCARVAGYNKDRAMKAKLSGMTAFDVIADARARGIGKGGSGGSGLLQR
jgi:hypothetical protein